MRIEEPLIYIYICMPYTYAILATLCHISKPKLKEEKCWTLKRASEYIHTRAFSLSRYSFLARAHSLYSALNIKSTRMDCIEAKRFRFTNKRLFKCSSITAFKSVRGLSLCGSPSLERLVSFFHFACLFKWNLLDTFCVALYRVRRPASQPPITLRGFLFPISDYVRYCCCLPMFAISTVFGFTFFVCCSSSRVS